jgi:hypothetical protein
MKRWTHFLATVAVAGVLALLPATAQADYFNQFTGLIVQRSGISFEAVANVNSFSYISEDPLDRVYAAGTIDRFVPGFTEVEIWEVQVIPGVDQITLVLTPQLGVVEGPTRITFTMGISLAQDQLVGAINSEALRTDPANFRRAYLLSLLRRCYP